MWEVIEADEPMHGPEKPLQCAAGMKSHRWQLSLEESQPTLITDCRLCNDGIDDLISEQYTVEMNQIEVSVEFIVEHYGDDVTTWIQVTP